MSKADALERVRVEVLADETLPLRRTAKNLVFGKGNPDADLIFIGEAPGAQEDAQGIPFVGAAGKELDKLLHGIGLSIEDVYIANVLKYRPPENRNPNDEEIRSHAPYLVRQIRAIKPKVICTLGNFSTKFVLAGFDVGKMKHVAGISQLHGKPKPMTVDGLSFIAIPLYHPAAILYRRSLTDDMVRDFQVIRQYLGGRKTLLDYASPEEGHQQAREYDRESD